VETLEDPLAALKSAGGDLLRPLGCATKCSLRKRTSFGWVLEVCGLCQRSTENGGSPIALSERYNDALDAAGWDACPNWALRYLADGPKPVPWASMQLAGQSGEPSPSAPAWAVRLLHLGTPMKSYAKKHGSVGVLWPKVFDLCGTDTTVRDALDTVVRLSRQAQMTHVVNGRHAYNETDCAALYDFLLEIPSAHGVFGGAAQENTRLVVRSPR
jgi:hypothetical protein